MKRMIWVFALGFLVVVGSGCAATGPRTPEEMFPPTNSDPRLGLVIVEGSPSVNIDFYDRAGRLIEQWAEAGANPAWTYNGKVKTRVYLHRLEVGEYWIEIRPFYYVSHLFFPRSLVELPRSSAWISVDQNPGDRYDSRYTKRYWGWILHIHTGEIPHANYSYSPKINIQGTGIIKDFVDWLGGRR